MTEEIISDCIAYLQTLPWWGVLVITFFNAYIENILPPAPSDVILVFIGTMVGVGIIDFPSALLAATLGSTVGFISMFVIGRSVDRKVVDTARYRFIPTKAIIKAEQWFRTWGYYVIVANRFLSGTRAVIAFLAGMSEMKLIPSTILSGISALAWNGLILFAGMQLGKNWREIDNYLRTYSTVVTIVVAVIALAFLIRWLLIRRKNIEMNK